MINKQEAINRLEIIKRKYERGMYGLAVEVVNECIHELEVMPESPEKFVYVDESGRMKVR